MLSKDFDLVDNKLRLKASEPVPVKKEKKRIAPTLVSTSIATKPVDIPSESGLTKGQQRFKNKIDMIERRPKDRALFRKIRGPRE